MDHETTRRELIAGAAAAAAAASLTVGAASASAATSAGSEADAMSYALEVERVGVIAYNQVLATSVLSASVREQLQVLAAQERQHVAKLERIVAGLGAQVSPEPATVAAAQVILDEHQAGVSLTALSNEHDCLRLLVDVESLTEGAYFKGIPQLEQPSLLRVSLQLMGSDAQHWTVLSGLQHGGDVSLSVPYPFVQGSS
jgi:rubrerythrin